MVALRCYIAAYGENVAARVPVLNVGTRQNPMYLPADVCTVMPGQPARSQLSPIQTANMIKFAVRMPYDNAESIVREGPLTLGLNGRNPLLVSCLLRS